MFKKPIDVLDRSVPLLRRDNCLEWAGLLKKCSSTDFGSLLHLEEMNEERKGYSFSGTFPQ